MSTYITGSPSVIVQEQDLATYVNPSSVSIGALVGNFEWGPCDDPTILTNEDDLVTYFGKPNDDNYKDWFCARNFLNYSNDLRLIRVVNEASLNACDVESDAIQIKSDYNYTTLLGTLSESTRTGKIYAKYPGDYANGLRVVIADYQTLTENTDNILNTYVSTLLDENSIVVGIFQDGSLVEFGTYSLSTTATNYSGETLYVITAVNNKSSYIWLVEKQLIKYDADGNREQINIDATLAGGTLEALTDGDYIAGWKILGDADLYDVSLLMQGGASATVGKYILESVAESRADSIACLSPQETEVVDVLDTARVTLLCNASTAMGFSSYRFMDCNYKYQYDSYNNCYRWVPLNGDIAGIFAEVDAESAPWYSPGNYTVKDTTKLAFNPSKAERDEFYKYRINPVVSFTNTGFVLYGDWTGADTTTSFNFVNVRRMFLYIEKSITEYARKIMWMQNDEITQTVFTQSVEPFLRTVQGGRGIEDFKVICNSTVNSTEVVQAGVFVAKIYIKPIYSIRWITLTFVSTRSDVTFEEIAESS